MSGFMQTIVVLLAMGSGVGVVHILTILNVLPQIVTQIPQ